MGDPVITGDAGLVDGPVQLVVTGARPWREIGLEVTTRRAGAVWRSRASFVADGDGCVDVGRQPSIAGTYVGVEPLGLIWSQVADHPTAVPATTTEPFVHTICATVDDERVAMTTLLRPVIGEEVDVRVASGAGLVGTLFHPRRHPAPAVLVLGGSEGGQNDLAAALLAAHGYAALAITYFGRPGLAPEPSPAPVEGLLAAIEWLTARPEVSTRHAVLVGTSKGGEAAFEVAVRTDRVSAVAAIVPSGAPGALDRFCGPVLVVVAPDDLVVPPETTEQVLAQLRRNDRVASVHGAGHLVQPPHLPTTTRSVMHRGADLHFGGHPGANAKLARVAWREVLRLASVPQ